MRNLRRGRKREGKNEEEDEGWGCLIDFGLNSNGVIIVKE